MIDLNLGEIKCHIHYSTIQSFNDSNEGMPEKAKVEEAMNRYNNLAGAVRALLEDYNITTTGQNDEITLFASEDHLPWLN